LGRSSAPLVSESLFLKGVQSSEHLEKAQPHLLGDAEHIAQRLGGRACRCSFKVGDEIFEDSRGENARVIWWSLLRDMFRFEDEVMTTMGDALKAEVSGAG
jgi:hypothetical protein